MWLAVLRQVASPGVLAGLFSLSAASSESVVLSTTGPLDFEQRSMYNVTVQVTDNGPSRHVVLVHVPVEVRYVTPFPPYPVAFLLPLGRTPLWLAPLT